MPMNLFQFFLILGFINGKGLKEAWDTQIPKYKRAVTRGWQYWPPLLFVMYRWVPVMYQNLYMDVFAFFFAVIISYIQSNHK